MITNRTILEAALVGFRVTYDNAVRQVQEMLGEAPTRIDEHKGRGKHKRTPEQRERMKQAQLKRYAVQRKKAS